MTVPSSYRSALLIAGLIMIVTACSGDDGSSDTTQISPSAACELVAVADVTSVFEAESTDFELRPPSECRYTLTDALVDELRIVLFEPGEWEGVRRAYDVAQGGPAPIDGLDDALLVDSGRGVILRTDQHVIAVSTVGTGQGVSRPLEQVAELILQEEAG